MFIINVCVIFFYLFINSQMSNCNKIHISIVGGYKIDIKNATYHVAVLTSDEIYLCGGSLITHRKVLTAAHCFFNGTAQLGKDDIRIFAGDSNLSATGQHIFESFVSNIAIHPKYKKNHGDREHDLAILTLTNEVPYDHENIGPIELRRSRAKIGTRCIVTGWGKTEFANVNNSFHLLKGGVKILDQQLCNSSYNGRLKHGMLCSGSWNGKVDACTGDSGGPLVCDNYLTGLVSFGYNCGIPNFPGIYTDVVEYRPWIIQNNTNSMKTVSIFKLLLLLLLPQYFILKYLFS